MHRLLRVLAYLLNVINSIQFTILSFVRPKKPSPIMPITSPLLTVSATALAEKIRQRKILCYDLVYAYVRRLNDVNPILNAVVDERYQNALLEAKLCDEKLSSGMVDIKILEREKPLYGLPVTIKESCSVKGLSYTSCTLANKGMKASSDGAVVEALRNAGAIILCVTNTPEMCCSFDSTNMLYGRTCNPYDLRYTSGGSSGGESALAGAGASLISCGSDIAGSLRIPALFCGVFTLKPTSGILSNSGHIPKCEDKHFQSLLTLGPICRYAEDLGLFMKVATAKCEHDLRLDEPVDVKQLKIYYQSRADHSSFGSAPVTADIERCILNTVDYFAKRGIHTEELVLEKLMEMSVASLMTFKQYPKLLITKDPKNEASLLMETLKLLFGKSQYMLNTLIFAFILKTHFPMTESNISYYTNQVEELRRKLTELLKENKIFIYPTFRSPTTFPSIMITEILNMSYTSIFNSLGFPAAHVPMGLNDEGLPIGIQVISAPYQDRLCLAVAKELEKAFGGWIPPGSVTKYS